MPYIVITLSNRYFYFFKFLRERIWKNSKTKNGPRQGTFPYIKYKSFKNTKSCSNNLKKPCKKLFFTLVAAYKPLRIRNRIFLALDWIPGEKIIPLIRSQHNFSLPNEKAYQNSTANLLIPEMANGKTLDIFGIKNTRENSRDRVSKIQFVVIAYQNVIFLRSEQQGGNRDNE